jgi:hypothetical protein
MGNSHAPQNQNAAAMPLRQSQEALKIHGVTKVAQMQGTPIAPV